MARFTGDFRGPCASCGDYVEFAVGVDTAHEPSAFHFGPQGPIPVELRSVELLFMVESELDVRIQFRCPLCDQWSPGRLNCYAVLTSAPMLDE